jgi:hypothetical protein
MRLARGRSTPAIRAINPHFVRNLKSQIPNFKYQKRNLPLALFMLGVFTQHAHNSLAPDHLAFVADLFD